MAAADVIHLPVVSHQSSAKDKGQDDRMIVLPFLSLLCPTRALRRETQARVLLGRSDQELLQRVVRADRRVARELG